MKNKLMPRDWYIDDKAYFTTKMDFMIEDMLSEGRIDASVRDELVEVLGDINDPCGAED